MNEDLLRQLQDAVSQLNNSEQRQRFAEQQQQINDSRLSALDNVMNQEAVGQALPASDKFAMALGNMYGSFRRGDGFTAGLTQTLGDLQAREDTNAQRNLQQAQQASQLANQTRLEEPADNIGFKETMKLIQMQMKNDFDAKQKELDRELKEKIAEAKVQSDLDKEAYKAKLREDSQIAKEDRKALQDLSDAEFSVKEKIAKLEDALATFEDYSKSSWLGTGPLATVGGLRRNTSEALQSVEAKFRSLNLDELSNLAEGMSRLFDSDAERRMFESAQPSITNDDNVNREIFRTKIEAARSLLKKIEASKLERDPRQKRLQELRAKYRR